MTARPTLLYTTSGELGEHIESAIDRLDVEAIEATDGMDVMKRLEHDTVDVTVLPADLPDVSIDVLVRRIGNEQRNGSVIVVGDVDRVSGPMIQVPADTDSAQLADRIRRAFTDRHIRSELDRHEQIENALVRITGSMAGPQPIERSLYDELRSIEAYRFVLVIEYNATSGELSIVEPFARDASREEFRDLLGEADLAPIHRAVDTQEVIQTQTRLKTRSVAASPPSAGVAGENVLTIVPLGNGEGTKRLLLLATTPDAAPDSAERSLLERIGWLCGLAVDQRSTSEETRDERLEGLLNVFAHELRNPLQVASLSIDAARAGELANLDRASEALDTMADVIETILRMASDSGIEEVEQIDVHRFALKIWQGVKTDSAELTLVEPVRIEADPGAFERLLSNLFRNAIDHVGEEVSVRVGSLKSDEGFYVEDDGPGIPLERRDSIFEWGASTHPDGLGIGLGFVREIVDAHDWEISVGESSDGGARFEILTGHQNYRPRDELEALFREERSGFVFAGGASSG